MHRVLLIVAMSAGCLAVAVAHGDDRGGSFRYPRVYGSTGRPYGPTQAHAQYQRQYGRSWHGYGGLTAHGHNGGHHHHDHHSYGGHFSYPAPSVYPYASYGYLPYQPYAYGLFGSPDYLRYFYGSQLPYTPGYVYSAPSLNVVPLIPSPWPVDPWLGAPGGTAYDFAGPLAGDANVGDAARLKQILDRQRAAAGVHRRPKPSTAEEKIRAVRLQAAGDVWLRQQNFTNAYSRYKEAAAAAEDRPEAHFRLAFVLSALGQFPLAVKHMKRGLEVDPSYPRAAASLTEIFGADNDLAKSSILSRMVAWVRSDIRDPDRLFFLGAWLYLDDDADRARELFDAALRVGGGGDHLLAFLQPQAEAADGPPLTVEGATRAGGGGPRVLEFNREDPADEAARPQPADEPESLPELGVPPLPPAADANGLPSPDAPPSAPADDPGGSQLEVPAP